MMRSVLLFVPALLTMTFLAPALQDMAGSDRQGRETGRSETLSNIRAEAPGSGMQNPEPALRSDKKIHSGRSLFFQQVAPAAVAPPHQTSTDSKFPDGVLIGTLLSASQPLAYIRLPDKKGIIVLRNGNDFASKWVVSAIHADNIVLRAKSDKKVRILLLAKEAKQGGGSR